MKVLLTGQGALCGVLAERLRREKHDVYIISGADDSDKQSRVIQYRFALTNERLDFSIRSIMPDTLVFMGAFDETYDFAQGRKAAMEYTSGLTNLLAIAAEINIPRFIYLSSGAVYGNRHQAGIAEDAPKRPDDLKALVVSQGEALCAEFGALSGMAVTCLRLSEVYGLLPGKNDCFAEAFAGNPPLIEKRIGPLYVSDASDAIFRVVTHSKASSGVYNVSAPAVELGQAYRIIGEMTGVSFDQINTPAVDLTLDSSAFANAYGFKAIVDLNTGLAKVFRALSRRREAKKDEDAKKRRELNIWRRLKPLIENFMVFLAAVAATQFSGSLEALNSINFLILYVVIVAITFGIFHTSVAVILASLFLMWRASIGVGFFDMIIDLKTTLTILELVVFGAICGYARDRMNTVVFEKNQALDDKQKELEIIGQINESNITIKRTLDDRLKNYDDSLAKIYSIVDKLNYLQPDAVFFSAVGVVTEIMRIQDVSIYIVTGDSFRMCRLMAETHSATRLGRKSIPLEEMPALTASFDNREVFVNHALMEGAPMMAAPIYSGEKLVSIIMLWAVPFDGLTQYNVNRFFVLSQLISSIIERAFNYSQSTNDAMCVPGMEGVLTHEAFQKMLSTHKDASRSNMTSCITLLVSPAPGQSCTLEELAAKVKSKLRVTDYVGLGEDGALRVLLTNTAQDELHFVFDRMSNNGVLAQEEGR